MDRRPKDYGALAEMLGAERCTYCHRYDHHRGGIEDGTIHWADRVMRWSGLVRFLKLVAISRDPSIGKWPLAWQRIYALNMALKEVAKEAHTRIPGRFLRADKAFVRASLSKTNPDSQLAHKAYEWSRKEAGQTWT